MKEKKEAVQISWLCQTRLKVRFLQLAAKFTTQTFRTTHDGALPCRGYLQGVVHAITAGQHLRDALNPLVLIILVPALELDHPFHRPDPEVSSLMASVLELPACPCRYLRANIEDHTWNAASLRRRLDSELDRCMLKSDR